jgi:hypothetical protein
LCGEADFGPSPILSSDIALIACFNGLDELTMKHVGSSMK